MPPSSWSTNANLNNALPGLSASDSFTIGIKKGGVTTNVAIDLSQVPGTLNLGNIVSYINGQLSAAGFSTRFQKTQTGGTTTSDTNATYGLQITPGGVEQVSLSAAATPSLYLVGSSGLATETKTTTNTVTSAVTTTAGRPGRPPDQAVGPRRHAQPAPSASTSRPPPASPPPRPRRWMPAAISMSSAPPPAISATSSIRARQDVYLTKYDSAGNVVWSRICWAAAAAPTAMAWRWIRPAAWWSPARPPPT